MRKNILTAMAIILVGIIGYLVLKPSRYIVARKIAINPSPEANLSPSLPATFDGPSSQLESSIEMNKQDQFIRESPKVLDPAQSNITCAMKEEIKKKVVAESGIFWEESSEVGSDFIYFNKESWALTVCHDKKVVSAFVDIGGMAKDENFVAVTDNHNSTNSNGTIPYFMDMNNDGKIEFILFVGNNVEGPTQGEYVLYQLNDQTIQQLYWITADYLSLINKNKHIGLRLYKNCFDCDFGGIKYGYFGIAEFAVKGKLEVIPFNEIRTRYPELLDPISQKSDQSVEDLFNRAYLGEDSDKLTKIYLEKIKPNEQCVLCDPVEIIHTIAGNH